MPHGMNGNMGSEATKTRSRDPIRVVIFSSTPYEIEAFESTLKDIPDAASSINLMFVTARLDRTTAHMVTGAPVVCLFATDMVDDHILEIFSHAGVKLIALRYPGESAINVEHAALRGIRVARTPPHSPTSIAEYAVTLMMCLNRKVHVANRRVLNGSFSLDGLVGFNVADKTVGIIGTGQVGRIVVRILRGFGCRLLAYDMIEQDEVKKCGAEYVPMKNLLEASDIITLHAPLVPGTYHMIGSETLPGCKPGVIIINTAHGGLIDIRAALEGLQTGIVGGLAMDVYEGETEVLFRDQGSHLSDWTFQTLKGMPNVIITGHQAALTTNALAEVSKWTIGTVMKYYSGGALDCVLNPTGKTVEMGKAALLGQSGST